MSWFSSFVDRYIHNADLKRNEREINEVLAKGKQREADALHRVAVATGDHQKEREAQEAGLEASRRRRSLREDVAIDVFWEDH